MTSNASSADADRFDLNEVIEAIEAQRLLLIDVATGGPAIDSVESQYTQRRTYISEALATLRVQEPFPWRSLWDWYAYWHSELPKYQQRRAHINSLASAVLDDLRARQSNHGTLVDWGEPIETWESLEGRLDGLKSELASADEVDGWQDVGRRARQIIIDAANLVFEAEMVPDGEELPKGDDAKNRIRFYLGARLVGSRHELHKLMRDALDLAHAVTHSSSASRIDAFAVAQAAILVVRCLQEVERETKPRL